VTNIKAISDDVIVGTNCKMAHIEEAIRQKIIGPDEMLLAIFDGIFFDDNSKRVGGFALNDFLIITNNRLTLWARDKSKDYVDYFPLSHAFVTNKEPKDSIQGTIKLELALPDVNVIEEIRPENKITVLFDFVPLPDLEIVANMITVFGCAHRDMIAGGASPEDREKTVEILCQKLFVSQLKTAEPEAPAKAPVNAHQRMEEPDYEIVEDDEAELEGLMTPLSRLDRLDNFNKRGPIAPAARSNQPVSRLYGPSEPVAETRPQHQEEFQWLNGDRSMRQPPMTKAARQRRGLEPTEAKAPKSRLQESVNADSIYTITRVGRAAWDGLEKLRREAESKVSLQALRENGMSLNEMTDFVKAINELLDTIGRNPAARDLAMTFLAKNSGNLNLGGLKPKSKKGAPSVEDGDALENKASEQAPRSRPVPVVGKALKVERRKTEKAPLTDDTAALELATENLSNQKAEAGRPEIPAALYQSSTSSSSKRILRVRAVGQAEASQNQGQENSEAAKLNDLAVLLTDRATTIQEKQGVIAAPDGPALN